MYSGVTDMTNCGYWRLNPRLVLNLNPIDKPDRKHKTREKKGKD